MIDEYVGKLKLTDNCRSCTTPLMQAQRNRKVALELKDASQTECNVTRQTAQQLRK